VAAASVQPPVAVAVEQEPQPAGHLLFVPGDRYSLVEAEGRAPAIDSTVALEGHSYRVVRIAPSPLPADDRRCAFLERL
jgi:hypothetical protein